MGKRFAFAAAAAILAAQGHALAEAAGATAPADGAVVKQVLQAPAPQQRGKYRSAHARAHGGFEGGDLSRLRIALQRDEGPSKRLQCSAEPGNVQRFEQQP